MLHPLKGAVGVLDALDGAVDLQVDLLENVVDGLLRHILQANTRRNIALCLLKELSKGRVITLLHAKDQGRYLLSVITPGLPGNRRSAGPTEPRAIRELGPAILAIIAHTNFQPLRSRMIICA